MISFDMTFGLTTQVSSSSWISWERVTVKPVFTKWSGRMNWPMFWRNVTSYLPNGAVKSKMIEKLRMTTWRRWSWYSIYWFSFFATYDLIRRWEDLGTGYIKTCGKSLLRIISFKSIEFWVILNIPRSWNCASGLSSFARINPSSSHCNLVTHSIYSFSCLWTR